MGVHIADVSHFVQPGSALDKEAQQRSTSGVHGRHCTVQLVLAATSCGLLPHQPQLAAQLFPTCPCPAGVLVDRPIPPCPALRFQPILPFCCSQHPHPAVYLVDRVIPMLPRLLCEELCRCARGHQAAWARNEHEREMKYTAPGALTV